MGDSDDVHVCERESSFFGREVFGELLVGSEIGADIDILVVEEDRDDSLCGAGVLDDLVGEEEVLVVMCKAFTLLGLGGPAEEEDEAVDGCKSLEQGLIGEVVEFLDLDASDADGADKVGEDCRIRLDGAPLLHWEIQLFKFWLGSS